MPQHQHQHVTHFSPLLFCSCTCTQETSTRGGGVVLLLMLKVTVVVTVKFCPVTATDDRDVGLAHRGGGGGGVLPPPPDKTRGPAREPSPLGRLVEGGDSNCAGLLQADRMPEIKVNPNFSSQISIFVLAFYWFNQYITEWSYISHLTKSTDRKHPSTQPSACLSDSSPMFYIHNHSTNMITSVT